MDSVTREKGPRRSWRLLGSRSNLGLLAFAVMVVMMERVGSFFF